MKFNNKSKILILKIKYHNIIKIIFQLTIILDIKTQIYYIIQPIQLKKLIKKLGLAIGIIVNKQ